MAAAAVPAAIKIGSMVGGSLLAKKLSGPTSQQQAGMGVTQGAATQLGQAAPQLMGQGQRLTQQGAGYAGAAGNYYQKLLGSRAGIREATAPDTAAALDYYKGAEGKIGRTMTGGSRDQALAELEREKVGKLALMPAMARGAAAQGAVGAAAPLLSAGSSQTGQGVYAGGTAAGAGNALYNQASDQAEQQRKAGSTYGNFIYDAVKGWKWGRGGFGGGGGIPAFDSRLGIPAFGPRPPM